MSNQIKEKLSINVANFSKQLADMKTFEDFPKRKSLSCLNGFNSEIKRVS